MANPQNSPTEDSKQLAAETGDDFQPGELAPFPASPNQEADLDSKEAAELKRLWMEALDQNATARRWEVLQAWESRLFERGYQRLLPLMGGGWIVPPFGAAYVRPTGLSKRNSGSRLETDIYGTYSDIIRAALTRDVPRGRFFPSNPDKDSDVTAADAANKYVKIFGRVNNLLTLIDQIVYYLCQDGTAVVVTDHIIDAQRFGREQDEPTPQAVPENDSYPAPLVYLVRHGSTARNDEGIARGQDPVPLDTKGQHEVEQASQWLKDKGISKIVAAPDARGSESAKILGQALGVPVEPDERFIALDIGAEAGKPSEEAHETIEEAFEAGENIPGGESEQDIARRVESGLFDVLRESESNGSPVAIVTHDSVIREITKLLGSDEVEGASPLAPGWIGGIRQNQDSTFSLMTEFPYMSGEDVEDGRKGKPRGAEIAKAYGKLERKVPMLAQEQCDMEFVLTFEEVDVSRLKGMFPGKTDKIMASGPKEGQAQLDRIARLSVGLGIEATYIIGDSWQTTATLGQGWFRPSKLMEVKDAETRASLLEKFPSGVRMIFAGDEMVLCRNEAMEGHVAVINPKPGTGQNRAGLLDKVKSIQKRLNNWVELQNHYFVRCVPQRYINDKVFDVEAIRDQTNVPGDYIPFNADEVQPGTAMQDLIWVEPSPQHNPAMPDFIKFFANEMGQLLSGALPTLFGSEANTSYNSATAASIQRDQALQRLTTPWHRLQEGMCQIYAQAVELAAKCRTSSFTAPGMASEAIRIELSDLRGSVVCYPEQEANFPESWIQKQSRYDLMMSLAPTNPVLLKLLSAPSNARLAKDMAAMTEFKVPEADAYEKQMGEAEILLAQAPLPNPARVEAQAMLEKLQAKMQVAPLSAEEMQQAEMMTAQAAQLPEYISSLPVIKDWDLHAVEAQACSDILNSPDGRRRRYSGTPKEKQGIQNLELHGMEHKALVPPAEPPQKAASLSANIKDLPPDVAANTMQSRFGVPASPQSFQAQDVQETQSKIAEKVLSHPKTELTQ